MDFAYRLALEETPNIDYDPGDPYPCAYGSAPDEGCPDKVTVSIVPDMGFSGPEGDYTIAILGFTTEGLGDDLWHESFNSSAVSAEYITQEGQNNYGCLWAEISQFVVTAVDLVSFSAAPPGSPFGADYS